MVATGVNTNKVIISKGMLRGVMVIAAVALAIIALSQVFGNSNNANAENDGQSINQAGIEKNTITAESVSYKDMAQDIRKVDDVQISGDRMEGKLSLENGLPITVKSPDDAMIITINSVTPAEAGDMMAYYVTGKVIFNSEESKGSIQVLLLDGKGRFSKDSGQRINQNGEFTLGIHKLEMKGAPEEISFILNN